MMLLAPLLLSLASAGDAGVRPPEAAPSPPASDAGAVAAPAAPAAPGDAGAAPSVALDRVERFLWYEQWVFDVCLSDAERDEARTMIAAAAAGSDDAELVDRAAAMQPELASTAPEELARLRSSVADEYVKTLKRKYKGKGLAAWLLRLSTESRVQVVAGKLPLTRRAAHCLADLSAFVAGQVSGAPVRSDAALRAAFSAALGKRFKGLPADDQRAIALSPREWERLRALWATADEPRREKLRAAWRTLLASPPPADGPGLAAAAPALAREAPSWR